MSFISGWNKDSITLALTCDDKLLNITSKDGFEKGGGQIATLTPSAVQELIFELTGMLAEMNIGD